MPNKQEPKQNNRVVYRIRIEGHLSPTWESHFDGLTITMEKDGETILTGAVDQAALHGVIKRVRDLGITLIEIKRMTDAE